MVNGHHFLVYAFLILSYSPFHIFLKCLQDIESKCNEALLLADELGDKRRRNQVEKLFAQYHSYREMES